MNGDLILKWVEQHHAPPIVQQLRDEEKCAAWNFTRGCKKVLDIASESKVTLGLESQDISRIDFSKQSYECAQKILKKKVNKFRTIHPKNPKIPYADNSFDGIVCIGPYDWIFLNINKLTKEIYRVLKEGGVFVFSVPTPQSPYYQKTKTKFRYYTKKNAFNLVNLCPWFLEDCKFIYQYPHPLHYSLVRAPNSIQNYAVKRAFRKSVQYTKDRSWEKSSYFVMCVRKIDYSYYLNQAIDCLFRPAKKNGFFDSKTKSIARGLEYSIDKKQIIWGKQQTTDYRYSSFALMGLLYWRASKYATPKYDKKIKKSLEYFCDKIKNDMKKDIPSYSSGPLIITFSLAYQTLNEKKYKETAYTLYHSLKQNCSFNHSEDGLVLFGLCFFYEVFKEKTVLKEIDRALNKIMPKQDREGLFIFSNMTTKRHQNQMYTLWGICMASKILNKSDVLRHVERTIDHTINKRFLEDSAILWEDIPFIKKTHLYLRRPFDKRQRYWKLLFECHQTFFFNAASYYILAGGRKNYQWPMLNSLGWIFGNNILKENLVEKSRIGIPIRFMTIEGEITYPNEMFKGTYEIGSYLMALTNALSIFDV